MIPSVIHYCWFGKKNKNDLIMRCIDSWKKQLIDYEFVEWNELNFDIDYNKYTREAYDSGKYAFVSDVARTYALYEHGGVYLDTDVELKSSLEPFLSHRAFSGFEQPGYPFTSVWGSEKGHLWPKLVLESYENRSFDLRVMTTINQSVSDLLAQKFEIDRDLDTYQEGSEGIAIYPSTTFCLDIPTNVATHHFGASWLDNPNSKDWKYQINRDWRVTEVLGFVYEDDKEKLISEIVKKYGYWVVLISILDEIKYSLKKKLKNIFKLK